MRLLGPIPPVRIALAPSPHPSVPPPPPQLIAALESVPCRACRSAMFAVLSGSFPSEVTTSAGLVLAVASDADSLVIDKLQKRGAAPGAELAFDDTTTPLHSMGAYAAAHRRGRGAATSPPSTHRQC